MWEVQQSLLLPREEWGFACLLWNKTGRHEQTIALLEPLVRRGEVLMAPELNQLSSAFHAAGREADSERAASQLRLLRH